MSQIQRTVNHCDVCGHEWLPQVGVAYSHCTSGKCRSRKWDRGEAEKVKAPVSKTGHAGSTPASPAKLIRKLADVPKAVSEGKGWSPNSKCAHGYMNSFLCERAGGGCGNKRKSAMR